MGRESGREWEEAGQTQLGGGASWDGRRGGGWMETVSGQGERMTRRETVEWQASWGAVRRRERGARMDKRCPCSPITNTWGRGGDRRHKRRTQKGLLFHATLQLGVYFLSFVEVIKGATGAW